MANNYKTNPIFIDTVSADIDIANLAFGLTDAPIKIKKIHFYDPTAADAIVLKDRVGNIIVELLCLTTNSDVVADYGDEAFRCQGLKLVATENTKTTGNVLIYLA